MSKNFDNNGNEAEQPKRVAKSLTDAEMHNISLTTKQLLDLQPKRNVRLPKQQDPKEPNYETVQINGYTYTIMKGVDVELPEEVYNILVRTGRY
jgi:hypothetical protein